MDAVAAMSRHIAERLTPAEAATADRVGAAYVAGGRRRRDLLRPAAADPGGFGGAGIGELPLILDALRLVSGDLLGLLAGHPLAGLLLLLAVRGGGAAPRDTARPSPPPPRAGTGPSAQPSEASPVLDRAITGMRERLLGYGVPPERAEQLTYETLRLVFSQDRDPAEMEAFLRALAGSPPAAPRPAGAAGPATLPATRAEGTGWMLPPWLWLYLLGIVAPNVPRAVEELSAGADDMAVLFAYITSGVERAGAALIAAGGVLGFLPPLLLLAGLAGVLLPGARGRWVERRHRLRPGDAPQVAAMEEFARRYAPGAEIRVGERHDRLARVYPVGWRRARVAVYPPLLRLWHTDRPAAEAVLLHELAHLRQGDHLIVGLAGPFAWAVRVAAAGLVLVLGALVAYTLLGGGAPGAVALPLLKAAFALPIGLVMPVAGLWVAELSADRYALQVAGPAPLARALGPARPAAGLWHRALGLLSHPPRWLRLRAARAWPGGTAVAAVLWPLSFVVWLVLVSAFETFARLTIDVGFGASLAEAVTDVPEKLSAAADELLQMAALLAVWPLLAPLWLRIWTPLPGARHRFAPYLVPALVPGLLAAGGLPATASGAQPAPAVTAAPTAAAPTGVAPEPPVPSHSATPERTGVIDDRDWNGRALPVSLRIQPPFRKLDQVLGDPGLRGVAAGWLGAGVWLVEKDGRLGFDDLMRRPELRPGTGGWFRQGDTVHYWLPIEQDVGGGTITTEIIGTIDLSRSPAVLTGLWARKLDGSPTDLQAWPTFDFAANLDIMSR